MIYFNLQTGSQMIFLKSEEMNYRIVQFVYQKVVSFLTVQIVEFFQSSQTYIYFEVQASTPF